MLHQEQPGPTPINGRLQSVLPRVLETLRPFLRLRLSVLSSDLSFDLPLALSHSLFFFTLAIYIVSCFFHSIRLNPSTLYTRRPIL